MERKLTNQELILFARQCAGEYGGNVKEWYENILYVLGPSYWYYSYSFDVK